MPARQPESGTLNVSLNAIQEQLERLLSCPSFQNSKRYPKFLKYVVEKGVSGSLEELKERVIGLEVFDRPPDYEPASDPIVRLVAGETRKRLAQYYLQPDHGEELRIEIPPGSYVPVFYWPQWSPVALHDNSDPTIAFHGETLTSTESSSSSPKGNLVAENAPPNSSPLPSQATASRFHGIRSSLRAAFAALVLVMAVLGTFWWLRTAPERHLKTFWSPMLSTNPSVLICIGDWDNPAPGRGGRRYVGPYDLAAMARLAGRLSSTSHQFSILMASDVTLTDLRAEPGILLGASNNKWTPMILADARYRFLTTGDLNPNFIVDTQAPGNHDTEGQKVTPPSDTTMGHELALISRIASPETGQVELVVAGTGANGTVAASEFVTNPYYFEQFTDRAPRDWNDHNIQILIDADVVNGRSGPPHMMRFYLY